MRLKTGLQLLKTDLGAPPKPLTPELHMSKETLKESPKESTPRDQALERALAQIEKSYGKGAIMSLDGIAGLAIEGISTGALSLDIALGGKGMPKGRIVEVFGPESSGKTTLCLHIIAESQKK